MFMTPRSPHSASALEAGLAREPVARRARTERTPENFILICFEVVGILYWDTKFVYS